MQLTTRNATENDPYKERRIREMDVKLIASPACTFELKSPASPVEPLLLVATSSLDASNACQSVDVSAMNLAEHICPLFFNRGGNNFGNACENGRHLRILNGKLLVSDAPP
jgi:hypothetical protein